jgi:hypothetical protein
MSGALIIQSTKKMQDVLMDVPSLVGHSRISWLPRQSTSVPGCPLLVLFLGLLITLITATNMLADPQIDRSWQHLPRRTYLNDFFALNILGRPF